MRTLQLYGAGSATANAVAQVIIPTAGRIKGIQAMLTVDSVTDNSQVRCELSKTATGNITTNGAQDPFLSIGTFINGTQVAPNGQNQFFPVDVPVRQGEIIYLHAVVAGTAAYFSNFILHYA